MSRVAAANASPASPNAFSSSSPTLGELLSYAGHPKKEIACEEANSHHSLEMTEPPSWPTIILSFRHLTYTVRARKKLPSPACHCRRGREPLPALAMEGEPSSRNKVLLDDISGEACDGEILAVLGESGSGKSTLIDALAGRISRRSLKGSITLDGQKVESKLFRAISAYVMQNNLLFSTLTVEETLAFAAEFRLPQSLPKSKKANRVEALIDQLGLRKVAKSIIGKEGHGGVSGGERRRISIGMDIIHDPIILFLDEPTSGLDSTSAYMVVKVLKQISQTGSIVIMSIHQPSYRIVQLLDQLLFLSCGHCVYYGPPENLPSFFADFGRPIPENANPTEFALDLICELELSPNGPEILSKFNRTRISHNHNAKNREYNSTCSLGEAIILSVTRGKLVSGTRGVIATTEGSSVVPTYANPFWKEIMILTRRTVTYSRRMPSLLGIRVGTATLTALILATVFWQLDNSPKGIHERVGFFAFAMSGTFYSCADILPVLLHERSIFMRETAYNAYRVSTYVLSQALIIMPSIIFLSLIFSLITFFGVGLYGGLSGFFFYFLVIFSSFFAGTSFVEFLSGVIPNAMVGYTVGIAVVAYYLLFSGFFVTRDRIPAYWIWFHYTSLIKYPYEAVLQNEFKNPSKCFVRGEEIFYNTPLGDAPEVMKTKLLGCMGSTLGVHITSETCLATGVDILQHQAVNELNKWNCLWVTLAWGIFFRIMFYISLVVGSNKKRR